MLVVGRCRDIAIIITLASLRPDSGDYTLRVMQKVCAVKFARRLDVTLEFN